MERALEYMRMDGSVGSTRECREYTEVHRRTRECREYMGVHGSAGSIRECREYTGVHGNAGSTRECTGVQGVHRSAGSTQQCTGGHRSAHECMAQAGDSLNHRIRVVCPFSF